MLHTKFQGHQPFGSGEEDFLRFLLYMGMAAILVMWPGPFEQIFVPPSHGDSIWNLASIGPVVSEEMFKECGQQTTDRQRRPTYPISSPMSLWLRWANKGWEKGEKGWEKGEKGWEKGEKGLEKGEMTPHSTPTPHSIWKALEKKYWYFYEEFWSKTPYQAQKSPLHRH